MTALVSGELRKLLRQPGTLFFGFFVMVLATMAFKLGVEGMLYLRIGRHVSGDTDLLLSAARAMGLSGNSVGHLLFAIGIGTVFATDYRYATFRLLVPRQPRLKLYAAKFVTCLICLAATLVVAGLGDVLVNLVRTVVYGEPGATVTMPVAAVPVLLTAFLGGLLELAVLAAFVGVVTTFFRSMMPAVVLAFLTILGASLLHLYLGQDADRMPLPSYAGDFIRAWLISGGSAEQAGFGVLVLVGWLVALLAAGMLIFERQELTSE